MMSKTECHIARHSFARIIGVIFSVRSLLHCSCISCTLRETQVEPVCDALLSKSSDSRRRDYFCVNKLAISIPCDLL